MFESREYVTALVKVRTEKGLAPEVARQASTLWHYPGGEYPTEGRRQEVYPKGDEVYVVIGVRWAAAMADGAHVFLALRAEDGGARLDELMKRILSIPGALEPDDPPVDQYYKDGRVAFAGQDGMP